MLDGLLDKMLEWLINRLGSMIYDNYRQMIIGIYNITSVIKDDVTYSPKEWNLGIFNVISDISSNYLLPIGILIITFVMVYELITMVINGNNFRDFDTSVFFRWFFKMFVAIFLLDHAFEIVEAIFELTASVAADITNSIHTSAAASIWGDMADFIADDADFYDKFKSMMSVYKAENCGAVIMLFILSIISSLFSMFFVPCVTLVTTSRFIYSYIYMAFAPLTFATLGSRELGQIGQNYIKNIIALGIQTILIIVVLGIYFGAAQSLMISLLGSADLAVDAFQNAFVQNIIISILLIIVLFKTNSVSKSLCVAS